MQELHALAHDVVRPYEGRLQPTLGDRLLILFGVPEAHEDDARRAVRVALELRRRVQVYQEYLGTVSSASWACRIGLLPGRWWWVGSRATRSSPRWWGMWSPWPWGSRRAALAKSCVVTPPRAWSRGPCVLKPWRQCRSQGSQRP